MDNRRENTVLDVISYHVRDKVLPKKDECIEFLEQNKDVVKDREWPHVKDYVRSCWKRSEKMLKRSYSK